MKTTKKAVVSGLAMIGAAALLAGCGAAPESNGASGGAAAGASDYLPCMVSDSGGFDDKSFNQLGKEGLDAAASELGSKKPIEVQSQSETDFASNLQNLVDQGCNTIITVGFLLAPAALESATANPDLQYVSIDDTVDQDFDGTTDAPNIKPIIFDTAQAAYLAGYLAAGTSKTGVVGTFGGMNIPTVTIFMDGFAQGVEKYNTDNNASVRVVGWDRTAKDGSFTGGFEANDTARQTAQAIIDQNVDVLLPVGGPIYQSAAVAIQDSGREIALVGVDADVYETDPSIGDLLLTSILKGIDVGTKDAIVAAGEGSFDTAPFIGTLENDGVGLAPFHDWSDRVPADLSSKVDALKADIVSGEIKVESYLAG
ncbi:basic membrane protein A [Microbacterium sp. ru370.1]|uniref:BMP family lipoprotein n=1 Tax=unclassified Microbacterium TaxID=2609290 RepID=UPI000882A948|nr:MULTISPECIES: BMP family ABC transporter substrate-binding protein [unclassified Microbacterium]SDO51437.1 basic membrane protein A [Microbacterium sp. ru370.1]SIT83473.1 basic membrane protein A [Microbacterium sp. RU1D]